MATPGVDCHLTLQHAIINGGVAVGFILKSDRRGPVVTVAGRRRGEAVWADQGPGASRLSATILALPRLLAPNGAEITRTPAQVRADLALFWAVTTPLTVADALGSFSVVWAADGLVERRYGDGVEWDATWLSAEC